MTPVGSQTHSCRSLVTIGVALLVLFCHSSTLLADDIKNGQSLADNRVEWPSWEQCQRVLLLKDYNTRVVVIGTTLLGIAAGIVGSFTLLRKRALMGDALCHATLPGIGIAFITTTALEGDGKSLLVLLFGATIAGLIGVACILMIHNLTRLKQDTALGIVLSVFFGAGVVLMNISANIPGANAAGLDGFILGKTASMRAADAQLIAISAAGCVAVSLLLFKELKLLCFDEVFANSRGYPVLLIDWILMGLVVVVSIVGLQVVGLVLMIALLVTPAAAARFWTETMWRMALVSAIIGAVSSLVGATASALFSKLPSGAMIVLVSTFFFAISMTFGTKRGVLIRWLRRRELNRSIDRQHLLRGMYEILEDREKVNMDGLPDDANPSDQSFPLELTVSTKLLLHKRSWSPRRLHTAIDRAMHDGLVVVRENRVRLTPAGGDQAARLTHQHRLWELYLITHADVAPDRVDRDADALEHVLEPEVVTRLEALLQQRRQNIGIPQSPHELVEKKQANTDEGATS